MSWDSELALFRVRTGAGIGGGTRQFNSAIQELIPERFAAARPRGHPNGSLWVGARLGALARSCCCGHGLLQA